MTDQKTGWGGKRAGSGRKSTEVTKSTGFRLNASALDICRKHYGKALNSKINDYIKQLAKEVELKNA